MNFVGAVVAEHQLAERSVLEVGSLDVNGSVRPYFTGAYLGTDMRAGPGVDEVIPSWEVGDRYADCRFGVVVCTEMLEHDEAPWVSVASMLHATQPGGRLILTARGYDQRGCFVVHDHPGDYWRFSVGGMHCLLERIGWTQVEVEQDPEFPGVLATALRP